MDQSAIKTPERTCIVTRAVQNPDRLIRFVAGPDGFVVPDIAGKLPGRGVWVSANRACVEQAVNKRLFSRGLKKAVQAAADLPALVDTLLEQRALAALGFARKAGECITGLGKVERALIGGRASAVLHATDGAPDGLRKLQNARTAASHMHPSSPKVFRIFTEPQMSLALGATNVIHAALVRGGAAQACLRHLKKLAAYRDAQPISGADEQAEKSFAMSSDDVVRETGPAGEPGR